jgi:hypothetical protein
MAYEKTIETIRLELASIMGAVDAWFDRSPDLRVYTPRGGRWSINAILEHVTLTSKYLLIIIDRWSDKAIARHVRGAQVVASESDLQRIEVIGVRGSFSWPRPEHMEPTGLVAPDEVRRTMKVQLQHCLTLLDRLSLGQGSLCSVQMSVHNLGKIDMYQWIYFLAQHVRRHIQQMEAIEREYAANSS